MWSKVGLLYGSIHVGDIIHENSVLLVSQFPNPFRDLLSNVLVVKATG